MRITEIHGTNLEVTHPIKRYVEEKMEHVAKLVNKFEPCDMRVDLGKSVPGQRHGDVFAVKLNLMLPGDHLHVEVEKDDLYAAVDEAVNKMSRQAKKYKEKHG